MSEAEASSGASTSTELPTTSRAANATTADTSIVGAAGALHSLPCCAHVPREARSWRRAEGGAFWPIGARLHVVGCSGAASCALHNLFDDCQWIFASGVIRGDINNI